MTDVLIDITIINYINLISIHYFYYNKLVQYMAHLYILLIRRYEHIQK